MGLFSLEHGKLAYLADFVLYGASVVAVAAYLLLVAPPALRLENLALVMLGLASWSLIEYGLHRFILHGIQPFKRWHVMHHLQPKNLICTPTLLSATLILILVFLPALLLSDLWRASALTLGLLAGYLVYSVTHHALHHWRTGNAWFNRRRHWHALHHKHLDAPGYYGVTSGLWDHVFGTARPAT